MSGLLFEDAEEAPLDPEGPIREPRRLSADARGLLPQLPIGEWVHEPTLDHRGKKPLAKCLQELWLAGVIEKRTISREWVWRRI